MGLTCYNGVQPKRATHKHWKVGLDMTFKMWPQESRFEWAGISEYGKILLLH